MRLRKKTPSAPQVPETVDPVTEVVEAAHAAAVAAKDWARARVLAAELDARQKALRAVTELTVDVDDGKGDKVRIYCE